MLLPHEGADRNTGNPHLEAAITRLKPSIFAPTALVVGVEPLVDVDLLAFEFAEANRPLFLTPTQRASGNLPHSCLATAPVARARI